MAQLRDWYLLTKPGIIYGNGLHFIAGALFAVPSFTELGTVLVSLIGMCLLIASACVANNIIDAPIDQKMMRTKKRALVTRDISPQYAIVYAAFLGCSGLATLLYWAPIIVSLIGLIAYISYVFIYTYAKRSTIHSTLIGTIPGALPIVAGYASVTALVDYRAMLLFILLVAWQMVHFYAIGIFRKAEYAAAQLPILPVVAGYHRTWQHMMAYGVLYIISAVLLVTTNAVHSVAGIVVIVAAVWWVSQVYHAQAILDEKQQRVSAKKIFVRSLILSVILVASSLAHFVLKSI